MRSSVLIVLLLLATPVFAGETAADWVEALGDPSREVREGARAKLIEAGEGAVPVPLEEVAGNRKLVPLDHPWIESARRVGTNLGDA